MKRKISYWEYNDMQLVITSINMVSIILFALCNWLGFTVLANIFRVAVCILSTVAVLSVIGDLIFGALYLFKKL